MFWQLNLVGYTGMNVDYNSFDAIFYRVLQKAFVTNKMS